MIMMIQVQVASDRDSDSERNLSLLSESRPSDWRLFILKWRKLAAEGSKPGVHVCGVRVTGRVVTGTV